MIPFAGVKYTVRIVLGDIFHFGKKVNKPPLTTQRKSKNWIAYVVNTVIEVNLKEKITLVVCVILLEEK